MPYTMNGMMVGMAGWMMLFVLISSLLLIALVAVLSVGVIRGVGGTPQRDDPLTILQRRYARGDLGAEEYERMRATLTGG